MDKQDFVIGSIIVIIIAVGVAVWTSFQFGVPFALAGNGAAMQQSASGDGSSEDESAMPNRLPGMIADDTQPAMDDPAEADLPAGDQEAGAEAMPTQSIVIESEPETTLEDRLKENPNAVPVTLSDVSGGNASGTAYVLRENGQLYHTVMARLPELSQGEFYEGWLVDPFPRVSFFSTGKMEQLNDGRYYLAFNTEDEYPEFTQVVITLERVDDQQPERHILEGSSE
jgi:hypothetical protein